MGIFKTILVLKLFLIVFFISCAEKQITDEIKTVINKKPLYENDYISLTKLHDIQTIDEEYVISYLRGMEADDKDNLYTSSPMDTEGGVIKFDKNGKHISTLGPRGGGPTDLFQPELVSYYNGDLHIAEANRGVKVMTENWNYKKLLVFGQMEGRIDYMKRIKNYFIFMASRMNMKNTTEIVYSIVRASLDFKEKKILKKYDYDRNKEFYYQPYRVIDVDSKDFIYFAKNSEEYTIIKYDIEGNPVLAFGREYEKNPYSTEAKEHFEKYFSEGVKDGSLKPLSKYPHVIRKITIDSHDNIWVLSGEIGYDQFRQDFNSEVDIFDENGKWLYNFKTNLVAKFTIIRNNRLYYCPLILTPGAQPEISVYKINYNVNKE